MEVVRLLLPFTVPSEDQEIPPDREKELATMFCLAEISRDKGGGLIWKKPPEEISFLTEVCYPFWLVPWRRRTLLFDGLDIMSHTISFDILSDAGIFIHEMKGSADKLEAYSAFLSHNLNYFGEFSGKGQKTIKGLIIDPPFTKDFFSLLPKAGRINDSFSDRAFLSPLRDESAVKASLGELSNFRNALREDVKNLKNIVKTLIETTEKHIDATNKEIEETHKRFEIEIARSKSDVMKKIEEARREYDQKIVSVSENTRHLIQDLNQELVELEGNKKRLTVWAEQCESEIPAAKARQDEAEAVRWRQELEKCREELLGVDKRFEEVNRSIEKAVSARDLEVSRLKSEYTSQMEIIMADLKKTEAARDSEVQMHEHTSKSLEESTSAMISQINRWIELRNLSLVKLDTTGYPITRRKYALVYLPFFLACYKQDLKKRYIAFPPSIVNTMTGVTKIKGALRSFKIRMLLQELSTPITNLLNRFADLVDQNRMFEDRIVNACTKTNILKTRDLRRGIETGLRGLREEEWLSEKEFKLFNERLEKTKP